MILGALIVPYSFTVVAGAGDLTPVSQEITIFVGSVISITTEALPPANTNSKYYAVLETDADEDEIIEWKLAGGILPSGLELDAETGIISGYSDTEGIYSVSIQAITKNFTANKDFIITVGKEIMIANSSNFPAIDAGSAFSQAVTIYNADNAVSWSIISGDFPPGLSLDSSTGSISGIPTIAGTYTFTIRAQSGYSIAAKPFTLTVNLAISNNAYLPNAATGENYEQRLRVRGATSDNVIWSADSKLLPSGLRLTQDGIISGVPLSPGVSDFTVYASADNAKAHKAMRITVDSFSPVPITTASFPSGRVNQEYLAELRANLEGVKWSHIMGTLPPGLSLNSSGLISGTPTEAGTFTFTVRAATETREGLRQLTILIERSEEEGEESKDFEPVISRSAGSGGGCEVSNFGIIFMLIFSNLVFKSKS